jgi:quercetin dioxygenase-like cupin family protein
MPRGRGEQQRDTSTPSSSFLAREESEVATETPSLEGWSIIRGAEAEWTPWGNDDNARAKLLGTADGYVLALVEAQAGYRGAPHEHAHAEILFVVNGTIRNQGEMLTTGDGYAAGAGSTHDDFEALAPSTYLSIFRL